MNHEKVKNTLHYVSAPCGTGKTYQLIREAIHIASNGGKVLICNTSIRNSINAYDDIQDLIQVPIRVEIIDSEHPANSKKAVKDILTEKLKRVNPKQGTIFIIQQQSFFNIDYFHNEKDWTIFWDESFDITDHYHAELLLEHKDEFFFPFIEINPEDEFPKVKIRSDKIEVIKDKLTNPDLINTALQRIYNQLTNVVEEKCDLYLYRNYLMSSQIVMTAILNPSCFSGFEKVVFFSALFEKSLMYQHWKQLGVKWLPEQSIIRKMKESSHWIESHKKPLRVGWCYSSRNQSKSFLEKQVGGKSLLEHSYDAFLKDLLERKVPIIDDARVLLMRNNNSFEPDWLYGTIDLNYNAMGSNEFKDIHNLIYTGSFNKEPCFYYLIERHLGYQSDEALHLYQIMLRTSYRDPLSLELVNVSIPCIRLFQEIEFMFPNVELYSLGIEHLQDEIVDNRKRDLSFTEEVYENKKSDLVRVFGNTIIRDKRRIMDAFILNGYQLSKVEVRNKWRQTNTKELWHLEAFPNAIGDYCKKKEWKLISVEKSVG